MPDMSVKATIELLEAVAQYLGHETPREVARIYVDCGKPNERGNHNVDLEEFEEKVGLGRGFLSGHIKQKRAQTIAVV